MISIVFVLIFFFVCIHPVLKLGGMDDQQQQQQQEIVNQLKAISQAQVVNQTEVVDEPQAERNL